MFDGKKILITGGTGSLGFALAKRLLNYDVKGIRIFSRNESRQVAMESSLKDPRLRFLIGDIRDLPRLITAFEDVDIVFHAAALKHVPLIEYNPFEAIKTNVVGTQNVIEACINQNVEIAIGVGTDKAVSPINAYGATKLLMEKLFVTANNYLNPSRHKTKFIALRYGNVLGSSGSVIPKFIEQAKSKQKITITEPAMTRFSITMDEALDFILESASLGRGSEIFVPKLKAYSIMDVKNAVEGLISENGHEVVGIRAGEKIHETLINCDEIRFTWELGNKFVIFNPFKDANEIKSQYKKIAKIANMESYSSNNAELLTVQELKDKISKSILQAN